MWRIIASIFTYFALYYVLFSQSAFPFDGNPVDPLAVLTSLDKLIYHYMPLWEIQLLFTLSILPLFLGKKNAFILILLISLPFTYIYGQRFTNLLGATPKGVDLCEVNVTMKVEGRFWLKACNDGEEYISLTIRSILEDGEEVSDFLIEPKTCSSFFYSSRAEGFVFESNCKGKGHVYLREVVRL